MADLNKTSKGLLGEASEKIGSYTESTGGGTPLAKGEKLKDHPEAKRVQQPRDEDGQFTYNSVNGKELKYGPSRGTTVPPFLRGIKLTFCEPGTKLKIDGPDGIEVRLMTIKMSVAEIVSNCKQYMEDEKGFAGMGEGSSIKKLGKKSESEKEAKPGIIGHADPEKFSKGTQQKMAEAASKYEAENSATELEPTVDGYKVLTDILNEKGETERVTPYRYWERGKATETPAHTPEPAPTKETAPKPAEDTVKATTAAPTPKVDTEKEEEKKVLGSMGLEEKDMEPEMSFNPEDTKDPKAFYSKYKSEIDGMVKQFNDKYGAEGKKINPGTIIQAIRTGKIKSMDAWKKAMEK